MTDGEKEFINEFVNGNRKILGFDVKDLLILKQYLDSVNRSPFELLDELE